MIKKRMFGAGRLSCPKCGSSDAEFYLTEVRTVIRATITNTDEGISADMDNFTMAEESLNTAPENPPKLVCGACAYQFTRPSLTQRSANNLILALDEEVQEQIYLDQKLTEGIGVFAHLGREVAVQMPITSEGSAGGSKNVFSFHGDPQAEHIVVYAADMTEALLKMCAKFGFAFEPSLSPCPHCVAESQKTPSGMVH